MAISATKRLLSVDCMRGLVIAWMILANNPGDYRHIYQELTHAPWNGWTATDFVFPLFLFLVGVSVALAVDRTRVRAGAAGRFWRKAFTRAALLIAIGLFENAYPAFNLASLRIPGVLQRIAVVYLAVAWLHIRLGNKGIVAVIVSVLLGYWALMALVPIPGVGYPSLAPDTNLEAWLDQVMLHNHIWQYDTSWDPEGILSTFPATTLGLIGVLAGRWLRSGGKRLAEAFALGLDMLLVGLVWHEWFPINKSICTSSFVLFVGGFGVMLLATCHWLLDVRGRTAWAKPFVIMGVNPLVLYIASEFVAATLGSIKFSDGSPKGTNLQAYLFRSLFAGWPDWHLASLAWAVLFLGVMFLGAWALYARRIVIKL
ncbi:MAG: acyltransferase family protein [Acidobacteriota bacterium]